MREGNLRAWTAMIGLALLGAWLATAGEVRAAGNLKIGTVDIQQILLESRAGKQAKEKVEAERSAKQKELTSREAEINKLQLDLEKQASILSEAARKEKQEAIERKMRDLRRMYDDFTRDLQKKENELIRDLLKDISTIVRDYGKQKGYSLILERGQAVVIYGADEIDITKEILAVYDAKTK
jgi:outer membrane protein